MSTTIHNGYCIPTMNLKELQDWVAPLRKTAEIETEKFVYCEMMKEAIYLLDLATVMTAEEFNKRMEHEESYEADRSILHYVRGELRRQSDSPFRGDLDVKSKLVIFPIGRKTLAILVNSDVNAVQDCFEKLPGVKEYAYWNNTDRPKSVSSKQWDKRREDWKKAVGYGAITKQGVVIELVSDIPLMSLNVEDVELPSLSKRAKRIATLLVEREFITRLKKDSDDIKIHEVINYLSSDEGSYAIEEKAKVVEKQLVKEISREAVNMKFSDCFKPGQ